MKQKDVENDKRWNKMERQWKYSQIYICDARKHLPEIEICRSFVETFIITQFKSHKVILVQEWKLDCETNKFQ